MRPIHQQLKRVEERRPYDAWHTYSVWLPQTKRGNGPARQCAVNDIRVELPFVGQERPIRPVPIGRKRDGRYGVEGRRTQYGGREDLVHLSTPTIAEINPTSAANPSPMTIIVPPIYEMNMAAIVCASSDIVVKVFRLGNLTRPFSAAVGRVGNPI